VCPEFSFSVLIFAFPTRVRAFNATTIGITLAKGRNPKLLLQLFSPRRATQTIGALFVQVKSVSAIIVLQSEVRSCLTVYTGVCVASTSGGAGTSMPPRR